MQRLIALALLALPLALPAQWLEGVHYQTIESAQERAADGTIEVIEVFWYGCPSCYQLEPHLTRWLADKPADVDFVRVAASMNPSWRVHARAYYTAESLDVVDAVHKQMFNAIHQGRKPMSDIDSLAQLFSEHADIDAESFRRAFDGFGVETRTRRGDQLVRRYRVTGTPTLIVNGKYRTGPVMARGYAELIQVLDFLVERERRAAGASAPD